MDDIYIYTYILYHVISNIFGMVYIYICWVCNVMYRTSIIELAVSCIYDDTLIWTTTFDCTG